MVLSITAFGHPNISATHKTTLEITNEDFVTKTGDCIVAISADKVMPRLDEGFKVHLREGKKIRIELECNGFKELITAYGHPDLTFTDPHAMIIRKSDYVCGRTLCIRADKAAADMNHNLVEEIKKGDKVKIKLTVVP